MEPFLLQMSMMDSKGLLDEIMPIPQEEDEQDAPTFPAAEGAASANDGFPGLLVTYSRPNVSEPEQPETETPAEEKITIKLDKWRFYVVVVFSALGFMQGEMTLTWNVIASSCAAAFGWKPSFLAIMQLFLYLTYLLSIIPFAVAMEKKGEKQVKSKS